MKPISLLGLVATIMVVSVRAVQKPYRLSLLGLMPFVETDPVYRTACSTAAQIVVETVNARSDILPDYEIALQIKNEGTDAATAPKAFVNFVRSFEGPIVNNTYPSPVVAGPSAACQTVALAFRAANYTSFTANCGGVYLVANRKLFSTLYRILMPVESTVMAILKFGLEIGKWRQIAILSYSTNPNNFWQGELFHESAVRAGFKVVFYSSEPDFTVDLLFQVKATGARFIVYNGGAPITNSIKFLCSSYLAGMTAPRYVYALFFIGYFVPNAQTQLPQGCTLDMLKEQFKVVFWFGGYNMATQNNGVTDFGYDLPAYEARFAEILKNRTVNDRDRTHLCHDSFMATMLTLNKSETILKERYNLTLRDFQRYPEIVGRVVNQTASSVDFTGLRIGRIHYSNRLEVDDEAQWGMQNLNGKEIMLYKVTRSNLDRETIYNLSFYNFQPFQPPTWFTKTGQPPKDLSQIWHRVTAYSMISFSIIIAVAILIQIAQSFIAHLALSLRLIAPFQFISDPFFVVSLLFGCSFSNVAAILLMFEAAYLPGGVCSIRPLFTVLGTTTINALLTLRMNAFTRFVKKSKKESKSKRNNQQQQAQDLQPQDAKKLRFKNAVQCTFSFIFALTCAVLVAWLVVNPFSVKFSVTLPAFDEVADIYFDITTGDCVGENQTSWMTAFVLVNVLLLALSCFFAYGARKTGISPLFDFECTLVRVCVIVAVTLFGAVLLITFIVSSHVTDQLTVVAVGNLLYSLSNCLILLFPAWVRRWPTDSGTSNIIMTSFRGASTAASTTAGTRQTTADSTGGLY